VPPSVEHRQFTEPQRKIESTVTERERTYMPTRETQVSQPERIQIPASPVVGNSGRQGIFQKRPPSQPAAESQDHTDWEKRRK